MQNLKKFDNSISLLFFMKIYILAEAQPNGDAEAMDEEPAAGEEAAEVNEDELLGTEEETEQAGNLSSASRQLKNCCNTNVTCSCPQFSSTEWHDWLDSKFT